MLPVAGLAELLGRRLLTAPPALTGALLTRALLTEPRLAGTGLTGAGLPELLGGLLAAPAPLPGLTRTLLPGARGALLAEDLGRLLTAGLLAVRRLPALGRVPVGRLALGRLAHGEDLHVVRTLPNRIVGPGNDIG
ncbi:hypothetical protein GCM10011381_19890 [Klenkia taihuensis]|nr:hypothetical protein GCM10011381_19890 [Klenkia taihuensis]